jgi:tetratricopeptide (TPR) repeat protein
LLQTDPEAVARAQKHKGDGNASFAAGKFEEAINHFTLAILEDGADAVFYSNRSACYAALKQFDRAADDGQKCIDIKKDWPKGYSRLALARFRQGNLVEAQKVYNAGLNQEPGNAALKEGACCDPLFPLHSRCRLERLLRLDASRARRLCSGRKPARWSERRRVREQTITRAQSLHLRDTARHALKAEPLLSFASRVSRACDRATSA